MAYVRIESISRENLLISAEERWRVIAGTRPDLAPDPNLPSDTRLWAALQEASGGTWGGCVYDADEIVRRLLLRSEAEGRSDDTEDVIRHRLELYRQETEPVIARYGRRSLLVSVDGTADIDAVTVSALQGIEAVRAQP